MHSLNLCKEHLNAVIFNAPFSLRIKTEHFNIWIAFLCYHVWEWELQTFKCGRVFWPTSRRCSKSDAHDEFKKDQKSSYRKQNVNILAQKWWTAKNRSRDLKLLRKILPFGLGPALPLNGGPRLDRIRQSIVKRLLWLVSFNQLITKLYNAPVGVLRANTTSIAWRSCPVQGHCPHDQLTGLRRVTVWGLVYVLTVKLWTIPQQWYLNPEKYTI